MEPGYRIAGKLAVGTLVVALVASGESFGTKEAGAKGTNSVACDNPLDAQHCEEINHGSIIIGARQDDIGDVGTPRRRVSRAAGSSKFDALAASCVDARTEALAQGIPVPPQIEARCGGGEVPVVTPGLVLQAFRELPLYRGVISADPHGWTLVNLETFFWCGDAGHSCAALGEAEQTVALLGRQVRVRPRIISYAWRFGDGAGKTAAAGRVGHVYRRAGSVTVQVTLTWTAEFSVAGQPFQPIGGTTTTTSPALGMPVRQARPVLVGGG